MKDIARHLGISASTVSVRSTTRVCVQELTHPDRAGSNRPRISANLLARSLRTQFTELVGLIIPIKHPHYTGRTGGSKAAGRDDIA